MGCSCTTHEKENVYMPKEAVIVSAVQMTASETHFVLKMADGSDFDFEPGQIVEAGLYGYGEIPLGLSSSPTQKGTFDLVVRKVGKVTTALCNLKAGDIMTIRGPLGKGFPVEEFQNNDVLIVAGGIGLCPTRSMIRYIMDRREEFGRFSLFFGARNPDELLFEDDLAYWRCSTDVDYLETVDKPNDRWRGNVGVITTLFEKAERFDPNTRVIICGPPIMYKFVIRELHRSNIPSNHIFVDLERRMKCGVGKCGHCQINDKYVCMDGPVFRYSDIKGLRGGNIMAKVKVAWFDFCSCEGCQIEMTNFGEPFLQLLEHVEPVEFREAMSEKAEGTIDVAFIEGSFTREVDRARLEDVRARSSIVVAYGACAVSGGVNALRNHMNSDEVLECVYGDDSTMPHLATNAKAMPISDAIKVDFEIPGCPISRDEFVRVVTQLVHGTTTIYNPSYPVCVECKMNETVCRYDENDHCMGQVARAGCGAPCPADGIPCEACRGMVEKPNQEALEKVLQENGGLSEKWAGIKSRMFTANFRSDA